MKLSEAKPRLPVMWVPLHANGDVRHKDCETGVISSANDEFVFVKFTPQIAKLGFDGATAQACKPEQLVDIDQALTRIRLNLSPSDLVSSFETALKKTGYVTS